MKIDIQDIKYWMDAIRNSEDRDRTLESFWGGQLQSKVWLISVLEKRSVIQNPEVVIHGGWNGVLATMLFNSTIGCRHITNVDIDPSCKELAYAMNKDYEMKGMFDSVTCDMVDYEYTKVPDIVINTIAYTIVDKIKNNLEISSDLNVKLPKIISNLTYKSKIIVLDTIF